MVNIAGYMVTGIAQDYFGKIYIADTTKNYSEGWIAVYRQKNNQLLAKIKSYGLHLRPNQLDAKGEIQFETQDFILYKDFNFDGEKDFALNKGPDGIRGVSLFDFYLRKNGQFKRNAQLTNIVAHIGVMFRMDTVQQKLQFGSPPSAGIYKIYAYQWQHKNLKLMKAATHQMVDGQGFVIRQLLKDLDGDRVLDSINFDAYHSVIQVRLSSQDFKTISSDSLHFKDLRSMGLIDNPKGFVLSGLQYERSFKLYFQYNSESHQVEVKKMTFNDKRGGYIGASHLSGHSKVNLTTDSYKGDWTYYNTARLQPMLLPSITTQISLPKTRLHGFDGQVFLQYQQRDKVLRHQAKEKLIRRIQSGAYTFFDTVLKGELKTRSGKQKPILIHYHFTPIPRKEDSRLIVGEVVYGKNKTRSFRLVGTGYASGYIYLNQYDENGIIQKHFSKLGDQEWKIESSAGNTQWISLSSQDTSIINESAIVDPEAIYGTYAYKFGGEESGKFTLKQIKAHQAIFVLKKAEQKGQSQTLIRDTVEVSNTSFLYKLPDKAGCVLHVQLFNHFALISADYQSPYGLKNITDFVGVYYKIKP